MCTSICLSAVNMESETDSIYLARPERDSVNLTGQKESKPKRLSEFSFAKKIAKTLQREKRREISIRSEWH